ncbi:hypothetical protein PPERSA_10173 [Pseudocohnilembus persalinus]|uniref:Transmembrane protein 230 n=1 Tax=Pseudocohnilembus persalinus TaxID=266149 RepID=A0A0V0QLK2_PSEPJ|nr:hypothetical protein PPERSA_10173 [Pseudocohnilembus persalinus]|eukprot:KRX03092.1 hypothetical protein PPERSA_10173 [Pseudocohnilembus persalinus]
MNEKDPKQDTQKSSIELQNQSTQNNSNILENEDNQENDVLIQQENSEKEYKNDIKYKENLQNEIRSRGHRQHNQDNNNNQNKYKNREVRAESPPPLRDNTKVPYKTVLLSFILFFAGILFSIVGTEQTYEKGIYETYPYLLMAVLLLIPGVYHVFIFICIWLKIEGYSYDLLANTEQD